jgi:hypothetical protein
MNQLTPIGRIAKSARLFTELRNAAKTARELEYIQLENELLNQAESIRAATAQAYDDYEAQGGRHRPDQTD